MIVIGTVGRLGVEHMMFGSTAEKVVRKAHCPVLSVKPASDGLKKTLTSARRG